MPDFMIITAFWLLRIIDWDYETASGSNSDLIFKSVSYPIPKEFSDLLGSLHLLLEFAAKLTSYFLTAS